MSIVQGKIFGKVRVAGSAGLLLMLAACGGEPQQQQPPAPEVTVQTVGNDPIPLELTYAARTYGSREVEVRARVSGILLKRRFQEGSSVREGQPMFQIDPEPVRARLASARAEVAVAKARLEEARRMRDRVLPLFEQNAVSQSRRDEAVSAFEVAEANLMSADSRLRTAQLDLEYTDVRAPISGLTSRETQSEGSLVSNEPASLLTKIVQVDPLYVEFSVPEAEAQLIRSNMARDGSRAIGASAKLVLEDGREHPQSAAITFVDNAVERDSGTVLVRAVMPNAEAQLLPGQFVRAKLEGVSLSNVVSIPRKAVMSSVQGPFVYLVGADAKVEMRQVQVGRTMGNNVIVTNGLAAGDRYIVEGVLKVQPGIQVSAVTPEEAARQAESQARAPKEEA
jgi:membrane fusion protein (multidrug efflux system)